MIALKDDDGVDRVLSCIRMLALRLLGHPDTMALAPPVVAARDALKKARDAWEEAHDTAMAGTGSVNYADDVEDAAVAAIARQLLVLTSGHRDVDLWTRLFSDAPSTLTEGIATDTQRVLVEGMLSVLSRPEYASLAAVTKDLAGAHASLSAAVGKRAAAQTAEGVAWNALQVAEADARTVYNQMAPRLALLFPGRKRLVDSFFVPAPSRKK